LPPVEFHSITAGEAELVKIDELGRYYQRLAIEPGPPKYVGPPALIDIARQYE
jgi:hypothetical protein